MKSRPLKSIIGNILYQVWVLSMALTFYLLYKGLSGDYWILIILGLLSLLQSKIQQNQLFVNFIKSFEIMKIFNNYTITALGECKKNNAIYSIHPHGIFSYTGISNLHTKGTFYENFILLGSNMALLLPISGLLLKLYGIQGADPKNFKKLLSEGKSVGIIPGGFEEATITSPKENRLFINQRKGFIYYGLKYGSTLYPVFNFGENTLFHTIDWFLPFRIWLNKFKLAGTIFWSRFLTIPEPNREIHSVCGKGIQLPFIKEPTQQDVEKYHQIYISELKDLYDQFAPQYAKGIPLKLY